MGEDIIHNEYAKFLKKVKDKGQVELIYAMFENESDAEQFLSNVKSKKQTFEINKKQNKDTKNDINITNITIIPDTWPSIEDNIFNTKVGQITNPLQIQE